MVYESMAQMDDPRVVLVSWRPTPDETKILWWVNRFIKRLKLYCAGIEILNVNEPATDKATRRDLDFTDFVSMITVDYADACTEEADHELFACLPALSDGVSPIHFWAIQLEPGLLRLWKVGHPAVAPWKPGLRWHFLAGQDEYFDLNAPDIDTKLEKDCILPITVHRLKCPMCDLSIPQH